MFHVDYNKEPKRRPTQEELPSLTGRRYQSRGSWLDVDEKNKTSVTYLSSGRDVTKNG